MKALIQCNTCGALFWVPAEDDPDTNGFEVEMTDEVCMHLAEGGDFQILDTEYQEFED